MQNATAFPSGTTQPVNASMADRVVVVRALHKSGSMFLYRFFQSLSARSGLQYHSDNHSAPDQDQCLEPSGTSRCVCPVRDFDQSHMRQFPDVSDVYQIFHVRDPRDMIVSEYYSFGWTHTDDDFDRSDQQWRNEVQQMSVDDYARLQPEFSSWPLESKFAPILNLAPDHQNIFVKYETMVQQFPKWVAQVLPAFPVRWPSFIKARYRWKYRNEFRVDGQHKRRITPGDHRNKLRPATIQLLNERYLPILKKFDYLD